MNQNYFSNFNFYFAIKMLNICTGFYSWRNTQKGSWFMQSLCEALNKYGYSLDLLTLLTFVNRQVSTDYESNVPGNSIMHQQKQIPCITSMLTRLVKFERKDWNFLTVIIYHSFELILKIVYLTLNVRISKFA